MFVVARPCLLSFCGAFGVPSKDLASAISEVVKSYVPPASLSSVAKAEETAVSHMLNIQDDANTGGGAAEAVVSGLESMVGMDDLPDMDI